MMTMKLGDDDARAVDLLLDRSNKVSDGNGNGGSSVYVTPVGDAVARRIGAVEAVLRLVAEMPVADPPADLAARTVERIRQRGDTAGVIAPSTGIQSPQQQPTLGQGPRHA